MFLLAQVVAPLPLYPEYPDIGSPIGVPALADPPLDAVVPVAGLVVLVGLVVGAGSLVGRFRHAGGVERQQLRWLAWGAALAAVALLVAFVDLAMHGGNSPLFQAALGVCVALLPLATGAAILRYRLYDIGHGDDPGHLRASVGLDHQPGDVGGGQHAPADRFHAAPSRPANAANAVPRSPVLGLLSLTPLLIEQPLAGFRTPRRLLLLDLALCLDGRRAA